MFITRGFGRSLDHTDIVADLLLGSVTCLEMGHWGGSLEVYVIFHDFSLYSLLPSHHSQSLLLSITPFCHVISALELEDYGLSYENYDPK